MPGPQKINPNTNDENNTNDTIKKAGILSSGVLLTIILFVITFTGFLMISDHIVEDHHAQFDQKILRAVGTLTSPAATEFFKAVTFFGARAFLFPAYSGIVFIYLVRKKWKRAIDIALIGVLASVILKHVKSFFARQRPLDPLIPHVGGFSFPSGHSFSSFTFFGVLIYLIWKSGIREGWKIVATVFLFLMGCIVAFSRVYLRVHYPSDVLGGFCLAVVWLIISIFSFGRLDSWFEKIFLRHTRLRRDSDQLSI